MFCCVQSLIYDDKNKCRNRTNEFTRRVIIGRVEREIKRLPYFKRTLKDQTSPSEFTLGKGHIKFFMTRLRYAKERYKRLREEAERRGFMVTDFSQNFDGLGEDEEEWWPKVKDKEKIIERISQRVRESKKKRWHYYGRRITKEEVISQLRA